VSICAVPLLILSKKRPNIRETWTFVAAVAKFLIIISMLPAILNGTQIVYTLAEVVPGVAIKFRVDPLGMLFALVASSLWILTSAYSIGYMRKLKEHSQTRYFCFFALALSATIGVAFSANLLTLYLFYEMLSLATYPLVTHHQDKEARAAGRKYLTYILGTSIGLLLPAMLISYNLAGTLEFAKTGFSGRHLFQGVGGYAFGIFYFRFCQGSHHAFPWVASCGHGGPHPCQCPATRCCSGQVGVFSIVRVLTGVFGIELLSTLDLGFVICVVASFTIIVASLIALTQDNLKRLLAFSTIGQLSYIVLGVGLLSPKGMTGGILHIAMHAFGKITLFFCARGYFLWPRVRGTSARWLGSGKRMPLTMAAFFHRLVEYHRSPSYWWVFKQMVPCVRILGGPPNSFPNCASYKLFAQCRVFYAYSL